MAIPLANLLANDALALRLVVESTIPPADVSIEWAHGIELVDPSPFLSGGEMVMLTGLRLDPSDAEQAAYVDRLVEARVAVVGFGTGVQYAEIPDAIVTRCRQHQLPLVEIPLQTPFMAVTREVARWEAAQRAAPLQDLIDLQQVLSRAAVRGGVPDLVRRTHGPLTALAVIGHEGGVIAAAAPKSFTEQVVRWVRHRRRDVAAGTVVLRADDAGDGPRIEIHALVGRQLHRGWLAVATPEQVQATDRLLINQVASLAALSLDSGSHARRRVVTSSTEAAALATLLRRNPIDAEVVELLRCADILNADEIVAVAVSDQAGASALLHRELGSAGIPHLCGHDDDAVLIVEKGDVDAAVDLITAHRNDVKAVGISPATELANIAAAVASARRLRAAGLRRGVWLSSASGLDSAVAAVTDPLREATAAVFDTLEAADAHGELIETLHVYLAQQGRWAAAAEQLGIHRHTLTSRIARIERLAGVDLGDAHQCAVLLLACDSRRG